MIIFIKCRLLLLIAVVNFIKGVNSLIIPRE
nr:MAG TPA: hypothetical protein [Bacteriophage sp.]